MRVAYLSYDGALDPLGSSQVVPYLEGLAARGVSFDLITFEKPDRLREQSHKAAMAARLTQAGIEWHPLRYHKSPRIPATTFDVLQGVLCLRRIARKHSIEIFHCRGDVTPVMVRASGLDGPLLLDMRGFFSDERVDAGSWSAGGWIDRAVRAMEQKNLAHAKQVVVLTQRARGILKERGVTLPIEVIPTCVDVERFSPPAAASSPDFDLVYFGSLGGWYMTNEMIAFAKSLRLTDRKARVLFLTNNATDADRARLAQAGVTVQASSHDDVPRWLSKSRASFFFIRATPSKHASCPTKLAEALAMGLPILTGPGVGDVDAIIQENGVGVVLEDFSPDAYQQAWRQMTNLMKDPTLPARCRTVAKEQLSLTIAVERYASVYEVLGKSRAM